MANLKKGKIILAGSLVSNFKGFISHFTKFNFGNFGAYFSLLLLLGIFSILVGLFWTKFIHLFMGDSLDGILDDPEEFVFYVLSSQLSPTLRIIGIGLFALMLRNSTSGEQIKIGQLFKSLTPEMWKNFFLFVLIILGLFLFLPSYQNSYGGTSLSWYYYLDHYSPRTTGNFIARFSYLLFHLIGFYFAALLVQLNSAKFTLLPGKRAPHVFAGMIMLMAVNELLMIFTNKVIFHFSLTINLIIGYKNIAILLVVALSVVIGIISIGAIARALGNPSDVVEKEVEIKKEGDQEILDDII
jgi:hypothetical protein